MQLRFLRTVPVVALAALLVLSAGSVAAAQHSTPAAPASTPANPVALPNSPVHAPSTPAVTSAPAGNGPLTVSKIRQDLAGRNIPAGELHLPALSAEKNRQGQPVSPTYSAAPAPMGVADIGLRDVGGSMSGYVLNTSSAEGTMNLTNAQSVYVDGDGPDMYGIQLNSVLTNVTLFGNSTYQFWAQNFVSYTSSSGELAFGDNIWNFSDLAGLISSNVFYAHSSNGSLAYPVFYFAVGPTFTVHYPFTVTFYLNSTTIADRPALFFNYTLWSRTVSKSGSFDYVIFNSSATIPTSAAPAAQFQINGQEYDPIGLINDIELAILGNDDGDTTTFYQLQATATIDYWNSTTGSYLAVPSAVNAGADTGETSDGVASYYTSAEPSVAQLGLGPSFLDGLWNTTTMPGLIAAGPGIRTIVSTVTPAEVMIMVNPGGVARPSETQWVPSTSTGTTTFYLPNTGEYFIDYLLSEYTPGNATVGPAGHNDTFDISGGLTLDTADGIYTPIIIWGNSELATFAASGSGIAGHPYVLYHNEGGAILPEFAQMNDFLFPVFPGLLLINTNDYVRVSPAPFTIDYPSWVLPQVQEWGLPTTNNLQDQFWNVSHVVVDDAYIQGWLSAFLAGVYPLGDVIFWNSTANLVAGVTFNDQSSALAFFGGSNNTVWGNTFLTGSTSALDPYNVYDGPSNQTGVWESESGDLIYNNYFSVPGPAYTPTFNPLACQINCTTASYTDAWNVSYESATASRTVLGVALTGSVIGTSYQGGNYWSNYGTPSNPYGLLPYADGSAGTIPPGNGLITNGGDYVPLVPFSLYTVQFNETGLPAATQWGVNTTLADATTTGNNLTIESPNGTVAFSVVYPVCVLTVSLPIECVPYILNATAPINVTVNGTEPIVYVDLTFSELTGVYFLESGLAPGVSWSVTVNETPVGGVPQTLSSIGGSIAWLLTAGTYNYSVTSVGYTAVPATGSFTVVAGTAGDITINFALAPSLTFTESGLPSGTPWTVALTQDGVTTNLSGTGATISYSIFNSVSGGYTFRVSAQEYYATPAHGSGSLPGDASQTITFAVVLGTLAITLVPTCAQVGVDAAPSPTAACVSTFNVALPLGTHSIEALASGYLPYFNNVTLVSNGTTTVPVVLVAQPSSSSSPSIGALGWDLIALLGVLVVVLAVLALILYSRRRPPARPLAPASSATAGPAIAEESPTAPAAAAPPASAPAPAVHEWDETPPTNPPGPA